MRDEEIIPLGEKAAFGVPGLDGMMGGGLTRERIFIAEGNPGTGKTTLALQFLLEGARVGEKGLYITLSETETELREGAASHGWTLGENIEIFELAPAETLLDPQQQQSLLYSSDLELGEATQAIFGAIGRSKPTRVVLDSLSEIRLLAQSMLRYRRQILALKHFFAKLGATVLMLDDMTFDTNDKSVHSIAHGAIRLEELAPLYGSDRRRLRILKYRGQPFKGGFHDFTIAKGGLQVYPRLVASEYRSARTPAQLTSGIPELDKLLGGGIDSGSSTLLLGPAGAGKSILVQQFVAATIARGEKAAIFSFDEELGILHMRSKALGIDLEAMQASGKLFIEQMDAAEVSPGEFAHRVRTYVEREKLRTVVIDSLNGYQAAMPHEQFVILHMHELLQYLNRMNVGTFLTIAQHGLVGEMKNPVDLTYLADTVMLLRYFEAEGRVRRALSVLKKRTGYHESTIREMSFEGARIHIGPPLSEYRGILRGVPSLERRLRPEAAQ
jgi:circadian clock protein KaiC